MLDFALEYRPVIDSLTGDRNMELRAYELSRDDWNIMQQLCKVLAVRALLAGCCRADDIARS